MANKKLRANDDGQGVIDGVETDTERRERERLERSEKLIEERGAILERINEILKSFNTKNASNTKFPSDIETENYQLKSILAFTEGLIFLKEKKFCIGSISYKRTDGNEAKIVTLAKYTKQKSIPEKEKTTDILDMNEEEQITRVLLEEKVN